MEIKVEKQDKKCTIVLIGKLDAGTAPQLEEKLDYIPGGLEELVFDMTEPANLNRLLAGENVGTIVKE